LRKGTKKRKWGAILLASAVSIGLLVLLLSDVDPERVLIEAKKVDPRIFVWVFVVRAVGFFALTWRTRAIAQPLYTYRWPEAMRAVFAGYFGNAVLPARIGELMKVGYLSRVGSPSPSACLAFVAIERVFDLVMLSLVALWVSFIALNEQAGESIVLLAVVSGTGALFLFVLARSPERVAEIARSAVGLLGSRAESLIGPRIDRFLSGLSSLDTGRQLISVLLSTLLYWAVNVATIAAWPLAFGFDLAWYTPLVVLVFLSLGTALPSTAAFVGTYHYAAAAALHLMGVPRETSVAMAFFMHAADFVPWTIVTGLAIMVPLFKGELASRPRVDEPSLEVRPTRGA
jgi:uncharacterized protein (TIRG00374 family)